MSLVGIVLLLSLFLLYFVANQNNKKHLNEKKLLLCCWSFYWIRLVNTLNKKCQFNALILPDTLWHCVQLMLSKYQIQWTTFTWSSLQESNALFSQGWYSLSKNLTFIFQFIPSSQVHIFSAKNRWILLPQASISISQRLTGDVSA